MKGGLHTEREDILSMDRSDSWLVLRIYKESLKLRNRQASQQGNGKGLTQSSHRTLSARPVNMEQRKETHFHKTLEVQIKATVCHRSADVIGMRDSSVGWCAPSGQCKSE